MSLLSAMLEVDGWRGSVGGAGPRSWRRLACSRNLFHSTLTSVVLNPWRFVMIPCTDFSLRGFVGD